MIAIIIKINPVLHNLLLQKLTFTNPWVYLTSGQFLSLKFCSQNYSQITTIFCLYETWSDSWNGSLIGALFLLSRIFAYIYFLSCSLLIPSCKLTILKNVPKLSANINHNLTTVKHEGTLSQPISRLIYHNTIFLLHTFSRK